MTLDNIKTIRKELQSVVSMNEEHNAFLLQALINFPKENENKKDFYRIYEYSYESITKREY